MAVKSPETHKEYQSHGEKTCQDAMRHEAYKLRMEKRGHRLAETEPDRQYVLKHVWYLLTKN